MKDLYIDGKLVIGIDHGYGNMKTRNEVFKSGVKTYNVKREVYLLIRNKAAANVDAVNQFGWLHNHISYK